MTKTYPQSLAGLYKVNFTELILKPIRMIDTKEGDYALKEIRFENGIGNAIFENGLIYTLDVKYDQVTNNYTFWYGKALGRVKGVKETNHIFEIKASLAGLSYTTDIMSLVDFGLLSQEED